jgi:hypothetical protein
LEAAYRIGSILKNLLFKYITNEDIILFKKVSPKFYISLAYRAEEIER